MDEKFYVLTNPVDSHIDIFADHFFKGIYNYTITDSGEQLIQSGLLDIKTGGVQTITLKSVFPKGIYTLVIKNATNVLQKTILKQ